MGNNFVNSIMGTELLVPDMGNDFVNGSMGTELLVPDIGNDFVNGSMGTELLVPDMGGAYLDNDMENPPVIVTLDPSSEVDEDGRYLSPDISLFHSLNTFPGNPRPGFRRCCGQWRKLNSAFK
jgi:hypothetical protein